MNLSPVLLQPRTGGRSLQYALALLSVVLVVDANPAEAQLCPPTVLIPSADLSAIYLAHPGSPTPPIAACTVTADDVGLYVKQNLSPTYKLHVEAQTEGRCRYYVQNKFCWVAGEQVRYLTYTQFNENGGTWNDPVNPPFPYPQSYSTYVAGQTSGPISKTFTTLGRTTINARTKASATDCQFLPEHFNPEEPLVVNVVKCKPNFWDRRLAPGEDPIQVHVPSGSSWDAAAAALDRAIAQWNPYLVGTNVNLAPTRIACGTGPRCVNVEAGAPDNLCGWTDANGSPITGLIVADAVIKLNDNWSTYNADSLDRMFMHELGHLLGLSDSDTTCGTNDAAMRNNFTCGSAATPR